MVGEIIARLGRARVIPAAAATLLMAAVVVACGSDGASAPDAAPIGRGIDSLFQNALIANPGGSYSIDDLTAVGYKKSKQFDTENLPYAREVWYGFFNQRDIEVWVYETHEQALEFGVDPAEVAILRHNTADLFFNVTSYGAYVVFGNLVMLCQLELATCEALIAELD